MVDPLLLTRVESEELLLRKGCEAWERGVFSRMRVEHWLHHVSDDVPDWAAELLGEAPDGSVFGWGNSEEQLPLHAWRALVGARHTTGDRLSKAGREVIAIARAR